MHHGAPEYNSFVHLTDIVTPKTNTDSVELCIQNQDDETVKFQYIRLSMKATTYVLLNLGGRDSWLPRGVDLADGL